MGTTASVIYLFKVGRNIIYEMDEGLVIESLYESNLAVLISGDSSGKWRFIGDAMLDGIMLL